MKNRRNHHLNFCVLGFVFLSACTSSPTSVELNFFAESEVQKVFLTDLTVPENSTTVELTSVSDGPCAQTSRGTFIISFPDDDSRTELNLSALALDNAGNTIEGEQYRLSTIIELPRETLSKSIISFCPEPTSPTDGGTMEDAAAPQDGGDAGQREDSGQGADAGFPEDTGLAQLDAGEVQDAEPADAELMDAEPIDSSIPDSSFIDASAPDSGPVDSGVISVCGNGILEMGEQCDDGNTAPSDGCNASCMIEPNYDCAFPPRGPTVCFGSNRTATASSGDNLRNLITNNRHVIINPGSYYIGGSAIEIVGTRKIVANGGEVIIQRGSAMNPSFGTVFKLDDGSGDRLELYGVRINGKIDHKEGRVYIYDSVLYGGNVPNEVIHSHDNAVRLEVERTEIYGGKKQGIKVNSGDANVFIRNSMIYENGDMGGGNHSGIYLQSVNSGGSHAIRFNTFINNADEDIICETSNFSEVIEGSLFYRTNTTGVHLDTCCYEDSVFTLATPSGNTGSCPAPTNARRINATPSMFRDFNNQNFRLSRSGSSMPELESSANNFPPRDFDFDTRGTNGSTTSRGADEY